MIYCSVFARICRVSNASL